MGFLTGLKLSFLLGLFIIPFDAFAYDKAQPLPAPRIVKSSLPSVDDAIETILFSEKFDTKNPMLQTGVDLTADEIKSLKDIVDHHPNPSKLIFKIAAYGFHDPRYVEFLEYLEKKGAAVQLVTDFNQYVDMKFKPKEEFSTDWQRATPKKGEAGEALKNLLGVKFKYNDLRRGIFSQPVFNRKGDSMIDIMHLKYTVVAEEQADGSEKAIYASDGTNNKTPNERVNRRFVYKEQLIKDEYNDHFNRTRDNFAKGGKIKDIASLPPLLIQYPDGHFELAMTDGKHNPNDRIVNHAREVAASLTSKMKKVLLMHFAPTRVDYVEAISDLEKGSPELGLQMIFDYKFSGLNDSYGIGPAFADADVYRQMGRPVKGINPNSAKPSDLWIYMSGETDPLTGKKRRVTDEGGAPNNVKVMHDKTTLHIWEETDPVAKKAATLAKLWSLSLNFSNHFANAETQFEWQGPATSNVVKAIQETAQQLIDTQPTKVIQMDLAIVRMSIASLTGYGTLEVPLDRAQRVTDAILKRDFAAVLTELEAQHKLPSTLAKRPSNDIIETRLKRLSTFLKWYDKNIPPSKLDNMIRIMKMSSLIQLAVAESVDPYYLKSAVNAVIWRPNLTPEQIEKLTQEALAIIDISSKYKANSFSKPVDIAGPKRKTAAKTNLEKVLLGKGPPDNKLVNFFDIDDNLILTRAQIILFGKKTGNEKPVSTGDFGKMRSLIGKEGTPWADFELRDDPVKGSFREFRSQHGENTFLADVLVMLKQDMADWEGPELKNLIAAAKNKEVAKNTYFVCARSVTGKQLKAGFDRIFDFIEKKQNIKLFRIPEENFISVGHSVNPSEQKLIEIRARLDIFEKMKVKRGFKIMNPDATGYEALHLAIFSDDDAGNIEAVKAGLKEDFAKGKYKNIKIVLEYTAVNDATHHPFIGVLKGDGTMRNMLASELREQPNLIHQMGILEPIATMVADAKPAEKIRLPASRQGAVGSCEKAFQGAHK